MPSSFHVGGQMPIPNAPLPQPPLFYGELASWWPLISPVEDYEEEMAFARRVMHEGVPGVKTVLELGSGGGHGAAHLKRAFTMTLVDLSEAMLEVSRALNPECRHVRGDMRTVRLGETFDAVFVHDAIDYMVDEVDLAAAIETAWIHCRPGGAALFIPDDLRETFEPGTDCGGSDAPDGRGVRFLEWTWDPDPSDTWVFTEYAFVLRDSNGSIHTVHETHRTGLFERATWLRQLEARGFVVQEILEKTEDDRTPRTFFLARRP